MTPIIEFKNYTFKYRSQSEPTLREIDLTVNPGEKVLIVGPSGSGKSTLVHCINGTKNSGEKCKYRCAGLQSCVRYETNRDLHVG